MITSLALLAFLLQASGDMRSAEDAFRAGSAAAEQHDLVRARSEFEKAVKLAPRVGAGHNALGTILLEIGDLNGAVEQLRLAHEIDPTDQLATANLATALSRSRKYAESLRLFAAIAGGPGAGAPGGGTPFSPSALSPEGILAYAIDLVDTGRTPEAGAVLAQAADASPTEWRYDDALGSLLAQQKRLADAEVRFSKAAETAPDQALPHLHKGSVALLEGKLPESVEQLTIAARLAPGDAQTELQLGRAQLAAGDVEGSLTALNRARELAPNSPEVQYQLGLALEQAGRPREALPLIATAAEIQPKGKEDPGVLTNYALVLVQTGSADKAIALYQRVLAREPQNALVHEDLGVAFLQQNDLDHAIGQFEAGLMAGKGGPQEAVLHYDLGLAWKLKDQLPKAEAELESAAKLDPSLPDPPYTLGVMHMQAGKFAEAAGELEKATSLRPENGQAWAALGSVYKQLEEPDKAVAALREASRLLPAQPGPHVLLGSILAQKGEKAQAAAERKKAAELTNVAVSRQKAEFALRSGRALLEKGDAPGAITQLQSAVEADPGYGEAHSSLADALERQHRHAEAALERQKAEQLAQQSPQQPLVP